jgi:hypothetical protein
MLVLLLIPFVVSRQDISGLLQRILVGVILVWWEVLAIRMYVLNKRTGSL